MRNLNPFTNTGVLIRRNDNAFLGSCFVFRYPESFLTAAHCVSELEPCEICILLPGSGTSIAFDVDSIKKHDQADIAALQVSNVSESHITWPQERIFDDREWGGDFIACGYPQEYSDLGPRPTPRVFRGHFQRFLQHRSHLGYEYLAAELSIGCPGGLSGAPVFNPEFHGRLYGIVTENIRTTTELETVLEVERDGKTYRELYHNVINYGIALWLAAISGWLDEVIPPVPQEELSRRATNQQRLRESGQH
jgi:hypothetical protein